MAKPNITALITAFVDQVQDIEDAVYDLQLGRALPWAIGATLDKIGAMVGRPRPAAGPASTDDGAYRALIYSQIVVNTSYGTPETVYSLLRLLGATEAQITELGNYTVLLQYTGALLLGSADLISVLERATPPIELRVTNYPTGYFGWADDPHALGFGVGRLSRSVS